MHRIGLKIWSTDADLLESARDLIQRGTFHYIEIAIAPGSDPSPFIASRLPYIIHCTPDKFGFNPGDPKKLETNRILFEETIRWAKNLRSDTIIIHPGHGSITSFLSFMRDAKFQRILVENMPRVGLKGEEMIGYEPEQIKKLKGDRFGFCLDVTHALKASASLNIDHHDFLVKMKDLKPDMYHVSGGHLNVERDEHLDIGEGDFDFGFIGKLIDDGNVTLETPRRHNKLNDDADNAARIRRFFGQRPC